MEDFPDNLHGHVVPTWRIPKKIIFFGIAVVVFFILAYFFLLSAPTDFQPNTIVKIEQGASLRSVSLKLKNEHVIRSRVAFEAFVIIYGGEKRIITADYLFENNLSVWQVAFRIARGEHHMTPIAVTVPEGFNINDIAKAASLKLSKFNIQNFLNITKNKEGYLFPDTYFFFSIDDERDVYASMSANFEKKIASMRSDILTSGKDEKQIITMASILEKEAKGGADRGIISGILWKRLSIGMPLQVDAAPETYKNKGLPEAPIDNPGLLAIKAAIYPQVSPYLYYLHDKNGNTYYAKTFSEHRANILKYLK